MIDFFNDFPEGTVHELPSAGPVIADRMLIAGYSLTEHILCLGILLALILAIGQGPWKYYKDQPLKIRAHYTLEIVFGNPILYVFIGIYIFILVLGYFGIYIFRE